MMGDGSLSQDEIDALLEGAGDFGTASSSREEPAGSSVSDLDMGDFGDLMQAEAPAKKATKTQKKIIDTSKQDFDLDGSGTLGLLLDVMMNMTVELGRTKMPIKEVLQFKPGSIVEMEKYSGEPVDILVNGRLIARGEVVVLDESYGVRVTEIIDPQDRYKVML